MMSKIVPQGSDTKARLVSLMLPILSYERACLVLYTLVVHVWLHQTVSRFYGKVGYMQNLGQML